MIGRRVASRVAGAAVLAALVCIPASADDRAVPAGAAASSAKVITLFAATIGKNVALSPGDREFRTLVSEINRFGKGIVQIKYIGYIGKRALDSPDVKTPEVHANGSGKPRLPARLDFLFLPKGGNQKNVSSGILREFANPTPDAAPYIGATIEPGTVSGPPRTKSSSEETPSQFQRFWKSAINNLAAWGNKGWRLSVSGIEYIGNSHLMAVAGETVSELWHGTRKLAADISNEVAQAPMIEKTIEFVARGWNATAALLTAGSDHIASSPTVRSVVVEISSWGETVITATDTLIEWAAGLDGNTVNILADHRPAVSAADRPLIGRNRASSAQAVPDLQIPIVAGANLDNQPDLRVGSGQARATYRNPAEIVHANIDGPALTFTNTLVINLSRWKNLPPKARNIIAKALISHKIGPVSSLAGSLKIATRKSDGKKITGAGGQNYLNLGYNLWKKGESGMANEGRPINYKNYPTQDQLDL